MSGDSETDQDELRFELSTHILPGLREIVDSFDGHYQDYDDGVLAFFGVPFAHEDDMERAVEVAMLMRAFIVQQRILLGIDLDSAFAIVSGDVVAGMTNRRHHAELVVTGSPIQQTVALMETVPPKLCWVTEEVQAATRHRFTFRMPSALLFSHLDSENIFELTGVRRQVGTPRGISGIHTQLIGRQVPMQAMLGLADKLKANTGGLIVLQGEAGIGKSRMMQELGETMERLGAQIWTGHCTAQRADSAFSLFSSIFRGVFDVQATDRPDYIRGQIDHIAAFWPPDTLTDRGFIELVMGMQPLEADARRLERLDPSQLRQQIFVTVRHILRNLANQRPMVLLLDDVQWMDSMSADLFLFLINMVVDVPILFVCTYRVGESNLPDSHLDRIKSLHPSHTLRIELQTLAEMDSRLFLQELLGHSPLPETLIQGILTHSGGNPYYIEEYVRVLFEQEYLISRPDGGAGAGQWQVNQGKDIQNLPLPHSLQTLLRTRYDRLPAPQKRALQVASVMGGMVDARLLAAALGEPAGGVLGHLEMRHLLEPAPAANCWRFSHPLIETVVYQSLLGADRRRLHLAVATALELQLESDRDEHADTLAYHFSQADQPQRALAYLVLAGERAAAHSSNIEARGFFIQAQTLLDGEDTIHCTGELCWRVVTGLAEVYLLLGDYSQANALLDAQRHLAQDSTLSVAQRAAIYRLTGQVLEKQSNLALANANYTLGLAILDEAEDVQGKIEMARMLHCFAWNEYLQGEFEHALRTGEQSAFWAQSANALSDIAAAGKYPGRHQCPPGAAGPGA